MPAGFAETGVVGLSVMGKGKEDERLLNLSVFLSNLFGFKNLDPLI